MKPWSMNRAGGPRALGAAVCAALCLCGPLAWAQDTFYSASSGDWADPDTWRRRGAQQDEDGLPDGDDQVVIQAGHQISFTQRDAAPSAQVINLYGALRLEGQGARLWAERVLVRAGGLLEALGPHTLTLQGGPDSLLVVYEGAQLRLQGQEAVARGQITGVLRESATALILEDSTQDWEPGQLRGYVFKLLSGRGRLWSFEVIDNGRHSVTLRPGSLGSPPGPRVFVGQADAQRPWLLEVPADTMDTQARPYQDGLLRGQWLKRPGLEEAGLRYISGALEGEAGQPDTLWVWPPLPQEEHQVRWSTTYGLEAGDAYTLYLPARVTIPEASQLPARPPAPGNAQIILNSGSHSVLRHLSLGYTFVTLRGLDVTQGQSELDIGFVDIHHADASCIFTGQGVHGLLIEQLHVRDVHPDNDLEEFGGRWTPEKQRGHGICLYGSQLVVRDNLVSNVNDDMLYFGEVGQALIEGNIAIRSGIFHGNSFENITLFKTLGDITLRGNLALGAQAALLLEERDLNSTVLVEDNILIQEQAGHIYRDRGPEGHGPAVLRNNFMLGGAAAPAWITLNGHDNTLEDNFIVGAALLEPRQAHRNAILAQLGARQPLILDPGEVTSNLLLRQDDQGGPVLAWRNASALPSRVSSNTMVGGVGLELAGQGVALRPQVTVDHNLIQGDLLRGASQDSDPGPVELEIAHNHYSGDRLGASSWQAGVIAPSNQHVTLAWVDPGALRLGLEDPAHWALDGQPVGYQVAGLAQPGRLPLPLPALWVQSEQREDPISGEPDPPPPTDADPMDADPSQPDAEVELGPAAYRPGGCVCATSGASSPSAWLWLLLPLTSWRRLR